MKLQEIRLPSGDVNGIDVDYTPQTSHTKYRSSEWLSRGFDGVRFIGAGMDRTHVRGALHQGASVVVEQHGGIVQFDEMTLHSAYDRITLFGLQNPGGRIRPNRKFAFVAKHCRLQVDPPTATRGRAKWGFFGYNCDVTMEDCEIDAAEAREHGGYKHGHSRYGTRLVRCKFLGSGAEGWKERPDATETAYAGSKASVVVQDCSFKNWFQTWSDRGGAAIVMQGACVNLLVERCTFWGGSQLGTIPAHQRSKAIMVSSDENAYDFLTGKVGGTGPGNGHIVVRDSAMRGGPGTENYSTILRVGRNGGTQSAARSVLIEKCGIWGDHMSLQLNQVVGATIVRDCNTPAIRDYCDAIGMNTAHEASIPIRDRVLPISEGYST